MMDANQAQEYAALMRQAAEITGMSDADEDQAATEEFMAWAQGLGLRAVIERTIDDDGHMIWRFEIDAGRGKVVAQMQRPSEWQERVEGLGLA